MRPELQATLMDVPKRLARLTARAPEQWLRGANTALPVVVTAILVVALAWRLADLTWSLVPAERADAPLPEVAVFAPQASDPTSRVALDRLTEAHLFGEPAVPPPDAAARARAVEEVVNAPDTTLNVLLSGVVARQQGSEAGQAIIVGASREQKVYSVGDTIDDTNGATLHSVLADRVLLNRSGRLETLRLPRELAGQPPRAAARVVPQPLPADRAAGNPESLSRIIGANASRISEIIRIAPAVEQGQVLGFRVNPGADIAAFAALGLEPGDIVTEVNGTVIDDPNRGLQVFETLGETTMASVTLLRDGALQSIVIDTTQLLELAENNP